MTQLGLAEEGYEGGVGLGEAQGVVFEGVALEVDASDAKLTIATVMTTSKSSASECKRKEPVWVSN